MKFRIGDKVIMTPEAMLMRLGGKNWLSRIQGLSGVVVGYSRTPHLVRVRRNGYKSVETYHERFWTLIDETTIPTATDAGEGE